MPVTPKKHKRHVSYKYNVPRLNKQGQQTNSKRDMWKQTRASRFKAPLIPKATIFYDGAPGYVYAAQWAREQAQALKKL